MEAITKRTIKEAEEMVKELDRMTASTFPSSVEVQYDGGNIMHYRLGLSTREYFAAMALQGILSSGERDSGACEHVMRAVEYANLLIEELNK